MRLFSLSLSISGNGRGGIPPVEPPSNTTRPAISGTATEGETLTASQGDWTNSPASYSFQWKADGANIGTGASYQLTADEVGKSVTVTVSATNSGGTGTATSDAVGPVVALTPFVTDADTYWWDFDYVGNSLDSIGHSTLAIARERLRGEIEPWQPTKARQPLKVTGGIDFNQTTNRGLVIDLPTLTNGKNGWYLAGVIQPTTANSQIMSIARNSSSAMSRMDMLVNGSRNFGFRAAPGDGASPAYVLYTSQITLGQVYAFEFLWDFDADTAIAWLNGVQQTPALGPVGAPWTNFPATSPSDIRIGNTIANNLSFNGTIRQLIFRDGVPSSEQRASISAYNQSRAA